MKPADAQKFMLKVLNPICRIYPDLAYYNSGLEIMAETGYSFYDSLILSGAAIAGCSTLYTEDLQDGQVVWGVRIENPFVSKEGRRKHT
jgi:predicted nucleic acid-binding protein